MKQIKNIFLLLLIMYLLFPFYFSWQQKMQAIIFNFILVCYILKKSKYVLNTLCRNDSATTYLWGSIANYCILLFISLLVPIIHQTNDYSYTVMLLRGIRFCLSSVAIFLLINPEKNKIELERYLLYFVQAVALYVAFSCILFVPGIRNFWISIVHLSGNEGHVQRSSYYTRIGLQGFSGFPHAFLCSLALIFVWYLVIRRMKNRKKTRSLVKYIIVLFAGTVFYGRIGMISALVSSGISMLYILFVLKKIRVLAVFLVVFPIFAGILYYSVESLSTNYAWVRWALEPLVNYKETGSFITASSNQLKSMYIMPEFTTLLFGDGRYTGTIAGSYYKNTDIGFLRPIFFWGLAPTILYYFILIYLLISIKLKLKHEKGAFLAGLCVIQLVLFELKGEVLFIFFQVMLFVYLKTTVTNNIEKGHII